MEAPESALIIDPAFLGDAIFDAALARALKALNPACRVGLVVRPPADRLAERMPHVDKVHVYDKRGADRGLGGLLRVARALAGERYQVAYLPHPSVRSALLAHRAGIERRVGGPQGPFAGLLLTERHVMPKDGTFVSDRLALLGGAGAGGQAPTLEGLLSRSPATPSAIARVGLALGSEWATKRWAIERAADFVAALDPSRERLLLLGSEKERPLYQALEQRAPQALRGAEDGLGGDVGNLVDHIARCDVLVAGDTGPLHIARALGVPVVALFGPTSELRHDFSPHDRVLFQPIECHPCSAHGADRCPLGHHRCMTDLPAARVGAALQAVISARALRP